jgi:GNAT superfamily N-acetyltransferase
MNVDLVVKDLTPELWPDLEKLFGKNGACAGCWCMWWRQERGEKYAEMQGATNKRRFKKFVSDGEIHGALAYADGEAVGWVNFGPRTDFPKLDRAPSLACSDAEKVWSIPCFFVHREYRGQGVSEALLDHALRAMKQRDVKTAEGYPVSPKKAGDEIPHAFAFTGLASTFTKAGFKPTARTKFKRKRVRKSLASPRS